MREPTIRALIALAGWGCLGMGVWTQEPRPLPMPWWGIAAMTLFSFNLGMLFVNHLRRRP